MGTPAVAVQILPPGASEQLLPQSRFFAHNASMVSAESGIGWEDKRTMHVITCKTRKVRAHWVPDFAQSNASFRMVVRMSAEKYIGLGAIPVDLPLEQLKAACNWRTRGVELRSRWVENPLKQREMLQHVDACRRSGSYVGLLNYVGYISWRCCEESTTISKMMHYLTPGSVRQIICRLARTARQIGFAVPSQHNASKPARPLRNRARKKPFRFLNAEATDHAAWRYFNVRGKTTQPPDITARDLTELVQWRQEGWKIRAGWFDGQQREVAEKRVNAGDRILAALSVEKAA